MRSLVREQISTRIALAQEECYTEGYCVVCKCDVPDVLMTEKRCFCNLRPITYVKGEWIKTKSRIPNFDLFISMMSEKRDIRN